MKKSLLDILWEELKRRFYDEWINHGDVDDKWSKYQIELIDRMGEEK